MKFPDKEHTVLSCGDVLIKSRHLDTCLTCGELTKWVSETFKEYYCSDECLEAEINDILQTEYDWWETFRQ